MMVFQGVVIYELELPPLFLNPFLLKFILPPAKKYPGAPSLPSAFPHLIQAPSPSLVSSTSGSNA